MRLALWPVLAPRSLETVFVIFGFERMFTRPTPRFEGAEEVNNSRIRDILISDRRYLRHALCVIVPDRRKIDPPVNQNSVKRILIGVVHLLGIVSHEFERPLVKVVPPPVIQVDQQNTGIEVFSSAGS